MRRVEHHIFVSHLFKNGPEIVFSFLFVFVAYAANAQDVDNTRQANVDQVSQYIADQIEAVDDTIEIVDGTEQKKDEFIVKLDDQTSEETVRQLMEGAEDIESVLHTENETYIKVVVPEGQKEATLEQLDQVTDIEIEPNYVRRATAMPNDTRYSSQWHHNTDAGGVRSETAWNTQTGSEDVVVAVIDSGVDTDHEDLADNMWLNPGETPGNGIDDDNNGFVDDVYGYDFVDNDPDPNPAPDGVDNDDYAGADTSVEHGTHVAGIIGATGNNAAGVAGVSWDVSIMAIRVLNDEGSGSDSDIVGGIEYAAENGADIINLSLGGYGESSILQDAIEAAANEGVLVIAAAGNDAVSIDSNAFYPACYDNYVTAVSSTGATGLASSFSNFANGDDCVVDIAGPGELIYSTLYSDDAEFGFTTDYGYMTGTSMATPVVSGVAALLKAQDSSLDRVSMNNLLQDNARDIGIARKYGTGLVNAAASIAAIPTAHFPTAPTSITAYKNSSLSMRFAIGERARNTSPFFSWSGASDIEGIVGYYVYFGKNKNADPEKDGNFQTASRYQSSGVKGNGVKYYLRVKTKDTDDNVSTEIASFTYIVDTQLPKPKKLKLVNTEKGVKVQWKKLKGHNIKRYVILRANKKGSFRKIKTVGKKKQVYIDKTVKEGRVYRYRVRAIDDVGNKKMSKKKTIRFFSVMPQ